MENKITVQFNKFKGEKIYKLNAFSNTKIESAIFVEITQQVINDLQEMLMEKYNYLEAVTADAKDWLLEHYTTDFLKGSKDYSVFYDEMINEDRVTGNASGSYTFNRWIAEVNLSHNTHLLERAADEFGYKEIPREWVTDAETADVIIRCYYLNEAIYNAMEEIKKEKK